MIAIYIIITAILALGLFTEIFNLGYQMGRNSVKQEHEQCLRYYTDKYK